MFSFLIISMICYLDMKIKLSNQINSPKQNQKKKKSKVQNTMFIKLISCASSTRLDTNDEHCVAPFSVIVIVMEPLSCNLSFFYFLLKNQNKRAKLKNKWKTRKLQLKSKIMSYIILRCFFR